MRSGVDLRQHREIHETVVDRRDQRVGRAMAQPAQIGVGAGAVDHHDVAILRQIRQRGVEPRLLLHLRRRPAIQLAAEHRYMTRHRQIHLARLRERLPRRQIAAERALPRVEINRADPVAVPQQAHDHVHGRRRLARAALLIAQHNHLGPALDRDARQNHRPPATRSLLENPDIMPVRPSCVDPADTLPRTIRGRVCTARRPRPLCRA